MAYMSRLSDYVRSCVAGEAIQEGKPIRLTTSGVRNELPVAMLAQANQVTGVFVAMVPPDDFARPTDSIMYTAGGKLTVNKWANYNDPVHSRTIYDVGRSALWNPTLASGELTQAHRGCTVALPAGTFTDVTAIRVPGSLIAVGAGVWVTTTNEAIAVGFVEEYNDANQVLIVTIRQ